MSQKLRTNKVDMLMFPIIFLLSIQFFEDIPAFAFMEKLKIKHILILLFIIKEMINDRQKIKLSYEVKTVMMVAGILSIISFGYMCVNGLSTDWISEIYFLLIPVFFVQYIFKNDWTVSKLERLADMFLISTFLGFSLSIVYNLGGHWKGQWKFSFVESTSPFESSCAHVFLLLYIIYTFINEKKRRLFSAILCAMAWKRIALLYLIFVAVMHSRVNNRDISKKWEIIFSILVLLFPSILELILTDSFSAWFANLTGVDLHKFLMFRFESIVAAMESDTPSHGLGTFLTIDVPWYGHYVHMSIHNDVIRLYLEVGLIGLGVFIFGYLSMARTSYSFIVMLYMVLELMSSHMLGNGSIPLWVLTFGAIGCFNRLGDTSGIIASNKDR